MALVTDKLVFMHIPKTGGVWIKHALSTLELNPIEMGQQHEHFPEIFKYEDYKFFEDRFVFTMIRHPITWYQSRWAFRIKHGWQPRHPLDFNCASNDFRIFVDNVIKQYPSGWCTWLFDEYINAEPDLVNFVGKLENIKADLLYALTEAGYDITEEQINSINKANSSDMDGMPSSYWAKYTNELMDRIIIAENDIIQRYYHDYVIDPNNLCGPQPY